jgi:S-(hydroxymethyl)glutathione dehydrogenase/alcohol dehydrogenase
MKTTAAVLVEINKPLEFMELEIPALRAGQVLVKILHSSICQTQINEICGHKGEDRYIPHTLGHEGSGVVLEIGLNVTKVKPGDHVVVSWIKGQGMDVPGTQYSSKNGVVNSGAVSTFMTHAVISENRLVPMKDFPMDIASLLGCAVPTGAGIVLNNLKARAGQSIAVCGAGGIGLSAIMMAKALGCNPIIAIDIQPHKLEMAHDCGATAMILANKNPVQKILDLTGGIGVDYSVECAGKIETMEMGFEATKKNGGRFVIAGNLKKGQKISLDPFDLICGKSIVGTWGGETDLDQDLLAYAELFRAAKLPLQKLVSHHFPLQDINKAIHLMKMGATTRVLLQNQIDE